MRAIASCVVAALCCVGMLPGQDEERLVVEGPQPALVKLGDRARLRLTVTNPGGEPGSPELPAVKGLQMRVEGPSRQSSQNYINGRIWSERRFVYTVSIQPQVAGEFTIPAFQWNTGTRQQAVGPLKLEAVEDVRGQNLGYVELRVEPEVVYVNEPVRVELTYGVDASLDLLRSVARNGQDYLEVEIRAPWLDELDGTVSLETAKPDSNVALVLNRHLEMVDYLGKPERDGRPFHRFRIERSLMPTRTGTLELPAPMLGFTVQTGPARRGFFGERMSGESAEYFAYGEARSVEVRPLPEAGRPESFSGAVGRFELEAGIDRRRVRVGESVKLSLTVRGAGNLEFLGLPDLPELDGYHVLGRTENRDDQQATVTFDLTPLQVDAGPLPAVEWSFFDTTPGVERYVELSTRPIPLQIEALPEEARLDALPGEEERPLVAGVDDIHDIIDEVELAASPPLRLPVEPAIWPRWLAVLLPWLLVLGMAFGWRRILASRADVVGRRARGARRAFDSALREGRSPDEALSCYLAARLGVAEAAVLRPDLAARLTEAGLDQDLASAMQSAIERGTAARYGGGEALPVAEAEPLVARAEKASIRPGAWLAGLLLAFALAVPATAQDGLDAAERAYRAGDYAHAAQLYRELAQAPDADRRLWLNTGNALYRSGRFAEALVAYERARLGMPRDPELRANIALAQRALDLGGTGGDSFADTLRDMRRSTTASERLWLCALLHLLAAALIVFGRGVILRGLGVIVLIPALALSLEVLWLDPQRLAEAIVTAPRARVVAEPRAELEALFEVRAGVPLEVVGQAGEWTRVRVGDREGYLPSSSLARID